MKNAVIKSSRHLGKMIESLQCGQDVVEKCFEECLKIAVNQNNHFSAGFIILRVPKNMTECLMLSMAKGDSRKTEVAAMLLLCMAAYTGDTNLLHVLCCPDHKHPTDGVNVEKLLQRYLPSKILYPEVLNELRLA